MKPMNLVYIMADQHNRRILGCYGNPVVQTPNLDALAARGVRFTNAYTNCPICVPARASFATGRYVHQIGYWDNGTPYDGRVPSWGDRLVRQGHHVTTIGKLHYRGENDDTGFPDQRLPMHVHKGEGDIYGMVRNPVQRVPGSRRRILNAGPGESDYTHYDRAITEASVRWLHEESSQYDEPWALFVSLTCPHPPLKAPQDFFDRYPLDTIALPASFTRQGRSAHPAMEALRYRNELDEELDEATLRRAIATYYGLCSFMDANVGQVLRAIDDAGLREQTRVIYTSDHGEMMGEHGMWGKSAMYEASVGVPFIMAGPDLPAGSVIHKNISLIDSFPTILDAVGAHLTPEDADLPGVSLWPLAQGEAMPQRTIFSEYHAAGSPTGVFMIRGDRYKYVHYVGLPPQLFDLNADPQESRDLAADPQYAPVLAECERELRRIVDPEGADAAAKAHQGAMIGAHGGLEAVIAAGPPFVQGTPTPPAFLRFRTDDDIKV
jgi:choline-sulfatase